VDQPSTAGDVITVANNLSAAFEDVTVYSINLTRNDPDLVCFLYFIV